MTSEEPPVDLHELIDKRFRVSEEAGGHWQILDVAGYPETPIVLRHDPMTGVRFVACPVTNEDTEPASLRWRATGIAADFRSRIKEGDEVPHLVVQAADRRQHPMLNDVVAALIRQGVQDPSEVVRQLEILQKWWEPPREMAEDTAVGLFGELLFLANWIEDEWPARIQAWNGADKSLKDFNWPDLALQVEVKTTQGMDLPLTHIVSSVNQLDIEQGHRLAVFSQSARCDPGGAQSLSALVDEIRSHLRDDPVAEQDFIAKLDRVGFHPDLPDFRFVVSPALAQMYRVNAEFPRIIPGHFVGSGGLASVDRRISITSYSIRLEGVEKLALAIEPPVSPVALRAALASY